MTVDVIVPAHNEEPRIAPVLAAIRGAPSLGQLIVVADDCDDGTAAVAEQYADRLIVVPAHNKGSAMAAGLAAVDTELVAFIDGDIEGLTSAHVDALLTLPPLEGQLVGLRSGYPAWSGILPSVSGERRIPTWLAESVPLKDSGWRAETLINVAVAKAGLPWRHVKFHGVTNLAKGKIVNHPYAWADEFARVIDIWIMYSPELITYMRHPNGKVRTAAGTTPVSE
jgi:glycosyltransferase involved in cell wall biosynthesis